MEIGEQVSELIRGQAASWTNALERAEPLPAGIRYLLVGSGSSYYVALAAAAVARRLGVQADALPAADLCLEPDVALAEVDQVVVISRSGATSEALWATSNAKRRGRRVLALTADPASELAQSADVTAASSAWDDPTVVMIRSFTGFLVYLQAAIARTIADPTSLDEVRMIPEGFEAAYRAGRTLVDAIGTDEPERIVILGGGVRWGVALEGMLKLTEMAHVAVTAYNPLEFRHGPRGALSPDDLVVLLGQTAFADAEGRVLEDIAGQTQRLAVIAAPAWFEQSQARVTRCELPQHPGDMWAGPLATVPLQLLAWHMALMRGHDPDHPANLGKVVRLPRG